MPFIPEPVSIPPPVSPTGLPSRSGHQDPVPEDPHRHHKPRSVRPPPDHRDLSEVLNGRPSSRIRAPFPLLATLLVTPSTPTPTHQSDPPVHPTGLPDAIYLFISIQFFSFHPIPLSPQFLIIFPETSSPDDQIH